METMPVHCEALSALSTITRTAVYNMHALSSETLHFRIRREVIEVTSIYEIVIKHCPNKPEHFVILMIYDIFYFAVTFEKYNL